MHNIIKTTTELSKENLGQEIQNAEKIYNIRHIENFNVQQFIIDSHELIPLEHLRFNTSKYNLFVVDEDIKSSGTFSLPEDSFDKDLHLTKKVMKQILMYPSLIARKNDSFRKSDDKHYAYIAKVYNYEHCGNVLKFWYTASIEIKQELLNIHPALFNIKDSGQTNELDSCCAIIKDINIIRALDMESFSE